MIGLSPWIRSVFLLAIGTTYATDIPAEQSLPLGNHSMNVTLTFESGEVAKVELDDTQASREFVSLLPLRLELRDYAATEKIADLPRRLDTSAAPGGYKPCAGDLAYYAPWGNLAIFHKPFSYSSGLVRLGRLTTPIEPVRRKGSVNVVIAISK